MTKAELFDELASVPDDVELLIMGAEINIVVHSPKSNRVVLDEGAEPFKDGVREGYYCVLWDSTGELTYSPT
jgi:hypothetical protein